MMTPRKVVEFIDSICELLIFILGLYDLSRLFKVNSILWVLFRLRESLLADNQLLRVVRSLLREFSISVRLLLE